MNSYYQPTRSRLAAAVVSALAWVYRSRARPNGIVYYVDMPRWACRLAQRMHARAWPGVTTF